MARKNRGRICRKKQQHKTQADAQSTIDQMVRRGKVKVWELLEYQCQDCQQWHVGHPDTTVQVAMKNVIKPKPQHPIQKMEK